MTSNIVASNGSRLTQQSQGFTSDQVSLIKKTIMNESASNDDLQLFGTVCQRTGLDPFSRQIYAINRKGKWTFQISIDGFRSIADRTGLYAGSDDPIFNGNLNRYQMSSSGHKEPITATVTVWKLVNGHRCPFTATASWDEYAVSYNGKLGELWTKMPFLMLSKCAESLALRKAFPVQLAGLYTKDEMAQAEDSDDFAQPEYTPVVPKAYTHDLPLLTRTREAIQWSADRVKAYIKATYKLEHPDFLTPEQFAELLAYLQKIGREIATPVVETEVVSSELP
jgi:phage recombination protein Bet